MKTNAAEPLTALRKMILLLLMSKLGKTILIHALKASRRNSDVQLRSQIFRQMKQIFAGCSGATDKNFLKYDGKDASECATRALRGDALSCPLAHTAY